MSEGQKIEITDASEPKSPSPKKANRRGKLKKTNIVRLAFLVLVIAVAAATFIITRDNNPIPKKIRKQTNFTIYYPKDLPIDKKTFQLSNNNKLLTYLVHYNGSLVYITEQPKPQYFDFADFDKGIKSPVTIQTPVGNATIGALGGRVVGDLPAIDSWILVSAKTGTSPDNIAEVLKRMQKT